MKILQLFSSTFCLLRQDTLSDGVYQQWESVARGSTACEINMKKPTGSESDDGLLLVQDVRARSLDCGWPLPQVHKQDLSKCVTPITY